MNKFSAVVFCFFIGFYVFNCIQASYAGLFDIKKKEACPARTKKNTPSCGHPSEREESHTGKTNN